MKVSQKLSPAAVVHKAKSTADRDVYCLCRKEAFRFLYSGGK